jgi:hypothetical protein
MTKAYSFWTQQGIRALNDVRADAIPFDKVVQMTDGAPTQFKNRFNAIQLCNLLRIFDLDWAMAVYPPTATFKGEHDGVGNLDRRVTGRYPTTRSYLPLLLA